MHEKAQVDKNNLDRNKHRHFPCASDPHKNVHFSKLSSIEANLPDINKESAIVVSVIPGIDTAKIDPNKMARLQLKRPHTIRILQVI